MVSPWAIASHWPNNDATQFIKPDKVQTSFSSVPSVVHCQSQVATCSPVALDTWGVVWGHRHSRQQVHRAITELRFLREGAALLSAPPSSAQEGTVLDDHLGFAVQKPKFRAGGSLMVLQVNFPGTLSFLSINHSSLGDKELQHVLGPPSPRM